MKRIRPFTGLMLVLVMLIMSACGSSHEPTQEQTEPVVTTERKEQSDTEPAATTESKEQSDTEEANSTKEPTSEETQTEEVDLSVLNGQYYTYDSVNQKYLLGEVTFNPDHTCTLFDGKTYKWRANPSTCVIVIDDSNNPSFSLITNNQDLTKNINIDEIEEGAILGGLFDNSSGIYWYRNNFDSQMAGAYQCLSKYNDDAVDSFEIFEDATAIINGKKYAALATSSMINFCSEDGTREYSTKDETVWQSGSSFDEELEKDIVVLRKNASSGGTEIFYEETYINSSKYNVVELTTENFFDYFEVEDHLLEFEPVYDKDFGDYQRLSSVSEYGLDLNYYELVPKFEKNAFAFTFVAEYRFNTWETYSINYNIDTKETEINLETSAPSTGDFWDKLTARKYTINGPDGYRFDSNRYLEPRGKEGNIDRYGFSVGRDFTLNRIKGTLYIK